MSENTHSQTLNNRECCRCGVVFAMTATYEARRQKDHNSFYCPNGHKQLYPRLTTKAPSELQIEIGQLKTETGELRTKNVRLSAQIDQLEAQLADSRSIQPEGHD